MTARNAARRLKTVFTHGLLDISIGEKCLQTAAEQHQHFWNGYAGIEHPNVKVINSTEFALAVFEALLDEGEDGSTLVTRMLDEAIKQAVENGCEGVDHDYVQPGVPSDE